MAKNGGNNGSNKDPKNLTISAASNPKDQHAVLNRFLVELEKEMQARYSSTVLSAMNTKEQSSPFLKENETWSQLKATVSSNTQGLKSEKLVQNSSKRLNYISSSSRKLFGTEEVKADHVIPERKMPTYANVAFADIATLAIKLATAPQPSRFGKGKPMTDEKVIETLLKAAENSGTTERTRSERHGENPAKQLANLIIPPVATLNIPGKKETNIKASEITGKTERCFDTVISGRTTQMALDISAKLPKEKPVIGEHTAKLAAKAATQQTLAPHNGRD